MSKTTIKTKVYLVGDVRYTNAAENLYQYNSKHANEFLLRVQDLMKEFGVIKLDLSIDPLNYNDLL